MGSSVGRAMLHVPEHWDWDSKNPINGPGSPPGIPHWEGEDRKGISGASWLARLAEWRRSRMRIPDVHWASTCIPPYVHVCICTGTHMYMERNVRSGLTCVLRKMTQVVGVGWERLLLQNSVGLSLGHTLDQQGRTLTPPVLDSPDTSLSSSFSPFSRDRIR